MCLAGNRDTTKIKEDRMREISKEEFKKEYYRKCKEPVPQNDRRGDTAAGYSRLYYAIKDVIIDDWIATHEAV